MADIPEPLTAPDCDLRDFPYMPLDVVRLRDSEMAAVDDAEAFRAAVMLWCACWHQVPAASLPDDDAMLCRLAGYGRDRKTWQRAREAGALRGFILCSDGRLYHATVAEKARTAWESRKSQRQRTEAARTARTQTRNRGSHSAPTQTVTSSVTSSVTENVTSSVTDTVTDSVTASKGEDKREEERIGEERKRKKEISHPSGAHSTPSVETTPNRDDVDDAFDAWNVMARDLGLPIAAKLDRERRAKIALRLKEGGGAAAWRLALDAIRSEPFLRGENDRGWRANLDFVCQPKSFRKLVEGAYRRGAGPPPREGRAGWIARERGFGQAAPDLGIVIDGEAA